MSKALVRGPDRPGQARGGTPVRKTQRLAAVGAMAALAISLGACSSSATPSTSAPAPSAPAAAATLHGRLGQCGVTTDRRHLRPGLQPGPDRVRARRRAWSTTRWPPRRRNNPLLTTLVTAVGKVPGLADTLNSAEAITVYAPYNGAFDAAQKALGDQAVHRAAEQPDPAGRAALLPRRGQALQRRPASSRPARSMELAGGDGHRRRHRRRPHPDRWQRCGPPRSCAATSRPRTPPCS